METILNGMERISRPLSMKMYEYDGRREGMLFNILHRAGERGVK